MDGSGSLPVTSTGRPITDRLLFRGMRINMLAGALGMIWYIVTQGMPLTMFMEALGGSGVVIGMAFTVMQFALVMQIPGAYLSQGLASRKGIWAFCVIISRILWFLPLLFLWLMPDRPQWIATITLWLAAVTAFLGQSVSAIWFGWMADLIPERMRGRFWGTRQMWIVAASLVAMALSGFILDIYPPPRTGEGGTWFGFQLLFGVAAVFGCLDIVVHLWVPEPRPVVSRPSGWIEGMLAPMRDRDFRRFTLAMGVHTFACGLGALGIVFLKKDYGFSYSELSAIIIAGMLGTLVSSAPWGWVIDRIGGRALAVVLFVLLPLPAGVWFFLKPYSTDFLGLFEGIWGLGSVAEAIRSLLPAVASDWVANHPLSQPLWLMLLASIFSGMLFGGIGVCQMNLVGALAPRSGRTMAMAVHWALIGSISAFGGVVAGKVMDYFEAHPLEWVLITGPELSAQHILMIAHALLFWFGVIPLMLSLRRRQGEPSLGMAFAEVLFQNPIRTYVNIRGIGSGAGSRRRASAVRDLGYRRSRLALRDLVEKLDDPAADVREEAALALGTLGTHEAIQVLIRRLDDPSTDLAAKAARGLRMAGNTAAVEGLLLHLRSGDRELKIECAHALGVIADPRAVHPLLEELARARDNSIVAALAEALARFKDPSAVYRIVPQLRQMEHPATHRSLVVSVGEIFGDHEEFYTLLAREQEERGSRIPDLMRRVRRDIRRLVRRHPVSRDGHLAARTWGLLDSYERSNLTEGTQRTFELAVDLACVRFGLVPVEESFDAFLSDVMMKDRRFSAGLWYLQQLKEPWPQAGGEGRTDADWLAGLFILAHLSSEE